MRRSWVVALAVIAVFCFLLVLIIGVSVVASVLIVVVTSVLPIVVVVVVNSVAVVVVLSFVVVVWCTCHVIEIFDECTCHAIEILVVVRIVVLNHSLFPVDVHVVESGFLSPFLLVLLLPGEECATILHVSVVCLEISFDVWEHQLC